MRFWVWFQRFLLILFTSQTFCVVIYDSLFLQEKFEHYILHQINNNLIWYCCFLSKLLHSLRYMVVFLIFFFNEFLTTCTVMSLHVTYVKYIRIDYNNIGNYDRCYFLPQKILFTQHNNAFFSLGCLDFTITMM